MNYESSQPGQSLAQRLLQKKNRRHQCRRLALGLRALEPELRSEGDLHVVVAAVIEVHLVTDFSPKADGADKGLNTAAGIQGKIRSAVVQPNCAFEALGSVQIRHAEIVKSNLTRDKEAQWSRPGLEFRSKQAMQSAEPGGYQFGGHSVREFVGKASREVIPHFRFQLHTWAHIEGDPPAQTYEVAGWLSLAEAEIFRESTDFHVIRMLLRQYHRGSSHK
jgi:hypothetical protein